VDLDDKPTYKALSYVWGAPIDLRKILVNGYDFYIRQNLFDFLQWFILEQDYCNIPIWIDQLCINQGALEERNRQVGMMANIYSMADEALIWLGLDLNRGMAFRAVEKVSDFHTSLVNLAQDLCGPL
jgi:hypothetical protein